MASPMITSLEEGEVRPQNEAPSYHGRRHSTSPAPSSPAARGRRSGSMDPSPTWNPPKGPSFNPPKGPKAFDPPKGPRNTTMDLWPPRRVSPSRRRVIFPSSRRRSVSSRTGSRSPRRRNSTSRRRGRSDSRDRISHSRRRRSTSRRANSRSPRRRDSPYHRRSRSNSRDRLSPSRRRRFSTSPDRDSRSRRRRLSTSPDRDSRSRYGRNTMSSRRDLSPCYDRTHPNYRSPSPRASPRGRPHSKSPSRRAPVSRSPRRRRRDSRSPRRSLSRHKSRSLSRSPRRRRQDTRSPTRSPRRHREYSRSPSRSRRASVATGDNDTMHPAKKPEAVVPAKRKASSRYSGRKIRRYDSRSPEKSKRERMREAFDLHDSIKQKQTMEPKPPKIDVLQHTPVLSFDNQSQDGFMDLDQVIAAAAQETGVVSHDTWDAPAPPANAPSQQPQGVVHIESRDADVNDPASGEWIHPSRLRRLSEATEMGENMEDDFNGKGSTQAYKPGGASADPPSARRGSKAVSFTFPATGPPQHPDHVDLPIRDVDVGIQAAAEGIHPSRLRRLSEDTAMDIEDDGFDSKGPTPAYIPTGANADPLPKRKASKVVSFAAPVAPATPASFAWGSDNDGLHMQDDDDAWGAVGDTVVAQSAPNNTEDPWGTPGAALTAMPPPPVFAAPSKSAIQETAPIDPNLTRQDVFDDFCKQKDKLIHQAHKKNPIAIEEDPWHISEEEKALILSRVKYNPGAIALATKDFQFRKDQHFIMHKEDKKFVPPKTGPTLYEEIMELGKVTLDLLVKIQPGPKPIVTRFDKEKAAIKARAKEMEMKMQKQTNSKENVKPVVVQQHASSHTMDTAEAAAIAVMADLIDVDIL